MLLAEALVERKFADINPLTPCHHMVTLQEVCHKGLTYIFDF